MAIYGDGKHDNGVIAKSPKRKFYKTVVKVEVLTEDQPAEFETLEDLSYMITEGEASGKYEVTSSRGISARKCAEALIAQGSDPEFFQLDENGKDLSE